MSGRVKSVLSILVEEPKLPVDLGIVCDDILPRLISMADDLRLKPILMLPVVAWYDHSGLVMRGCQGCLGMVMPNTTCIN